jgi:hypothetical protein
MEEDLWKVTASIRFCAIGSISVDKVWDSLNILSSSPFESGGPSMRNTLFAFLFLASPCLGQVYDVNDDHVVGAHEALTLAEFWKSPASASNEHNHLGQTWDGNENPLFIRGSFPDFLGAPLLLANTASTGNGLAVFESPTGIVIVNSKDDGLIVSGSEGNGIRVLFTGGYHQASPAPAACGVYVGEASGFGVYALSHSADYYGGYFSNTVLGGRGLYARGGRNADVDLMLGGENASSDDGVMASTEYPDSDMVLRANDNVVVHLDDNEGFINFDDSIFQIVNGDDINALTVDEQGNLSFPGSSKKSSGETCVDHPLDPSGKYLVHSDVESPDRLNVYSGVAILSETGEAWVSLPDYFEAYNSDFRYQLTPIGAPAPNLYVADEIQGNRFRVAGGKPGLKVSWQLTGVRQDLYAKAHPLLAEQEKKQEEKGKYLHPELYGEEFSKSVGFFAEP